MLGIGTGLLYVGGFAFGYVLGGPKRRKKVPYDLPPTANDNTPLRRFRIR